MLSALGLPFYSKYLRICSKLDLKFYYGRVILMAFRFDHSGSLNILKDGQPFLSGISISLHRENGEKIPLSFSSADTHRAFFEGDLCRASLDISDFDEGFGLSAAGELILNQQKGAYLDNADSNLNSGGALSITIEKIENLKAYNACYNISNFWCASSMGSSINDLPDKTQAVLMELNGGFAYMMTVCDKKYKSVLSGAAEGIKITLCSYKRGETSLDSRALVIGLGDDVYGLPEKTVEMGYSFLQKPYATRKGRRYPETFEYLGWCSWDAFPLCVSEEGLLQKAQEFKDKGIPVRFFIVDDMWAQLKMKDTREIMHANELSSLEADKERFPNGLGPALHKLRQQYGLKVGVWHPITGYWHGIDKNGELADKFKEYLCETEDGRLTVDPSAEKFYRFHDLFYRYLKECGADFVKVDNQGSIEWFYRKLGFVGQISENIHTALEAACGAYFDGDIINCMGCSTENMWNRPNSVVNRCSNDFLPEDRFWFIRHILQASFTAYHHSGFTQGDFDMFWTDDAQAVKNSVLRAISGGPVYVSDKLGRSQKDVIMPMVLSDGRVLRCQNPAFPTRDCLMNDPETNGKIFKVWNKTANGGVVAAFNLDKDEKPVGGEVYAADVDGMDGQEFLVYDYFEGRAFKINAADAIHVELKDYDAFKLYNFIGIIDGFAAIGLMDKYVPTAAYSCFGKGKYNVLDSGKFGFYCADKVRVFCDGSPLDIKTGEGYSYVDISGDGNHILEFYKGE